MVKEKDIYTLAKRIKTRKKSARGYSSGVRFRVRVRVQEKDIYNQAKR